MVKLEKINFQEIIMTGLSKGLTLDETMQLAYLDGRFGNLHLDARMKTVLTLQEKGLVNYTRETAKVSINLAGKAIFRPNKRDNSSLAKSLRELYPTGLKDDRWPWRGTNVEIKNKLDRFMDLYPEYTEQQIVDATKNYLTKMVENDKGRSLLGYFILKNTEDGVKSILAQYIDLEDQFKKEARINPNGNMMQL